ncbi:MAG: myo-inosose-2 dehydratase [Clostridiales bacterium]|jgi:inosose dehydratase|nr:myo-inosose-2 dehydratase [Clostridiales bacterium]HOB63827.1 myo-inosose-2 dehydratase [Clostridia bacterium]HOK82295.1 myo-inosose-2 dehydratase [Clostridia bacterium]HOL61098.1 myo-inosose-2 dehydratase [Clostridia bacterium]HPO53768.1 myo-inosose-2 dehydratase [Clostridia bacterium]
MLDKKNIKLGIAPIAWTNDDMPDLGAENTFEQCVSEMALAGYKGCEIGNKYPKKPKDLKKALKLRKLKIANSWFSTFLLTEPYEKVEKEFRKKCKFLKAVGAGIIGVSEQSYSIQGQMETPVFEKKYVLNDAEWKTLNEGLNKLGAVAKEYGITMTFHHHMGTVVQTEAEIDRMMEGTDPSLVFLLFDSGHLAYCGENYMSVLNKYASRIKHVHLKDIRPEVVAKVKAEHLSFLQGVRLGTFTVPGDGAIDFVPIIEALGKAGYKGWLLVEAEQDPAKANPLEYAIKARKYIKKIAKI